MSEEEKINVRHIIGRPVVREEVARIMKMAKRIDDEDRIERKAAEKGNFMLIFFVWLVVWAVVCAFYL